VVLLYGDVQALRDAAVSEIRERVIEGGPVDFNEDRFDLASGADPGAILAAAQTLPVLAPRRLVRVRGMEDRRAARFIEKILPGYLEEPVPTTCLLLEARRVDRRLRWVKQVGAVGELRACVAPSRPADLRGWVEDRIRAEGKKSDRGTAQALLDRIGADPDRLASEIAKLVLYVGDRREVTPDDVAEASGGGRPRAIFELTDAIGSRDRARALRLVHHLHAQGEAPLALLAGLGNHLRRLLRARECEPLDPATVQRELGVHPYAAQKLVEQLRRVDRRRLRTALEAVARTDRALKGGTPLPPDRAMEQLVLAISAR
jgi:DNA polymerase-3 subunit delta